MPQARPYISLSTSELGRLADDTEDPEIRAAVIYELQNRSRGNARHLLARLEAETDGAQGRQDELFNDQDAPISRPTSQRPKPDYTPTDEQNAAVESFLKGQSLKVTAFAGAGKTSTLKLMAGARLGRGLYLAFNRSIAEEARAEFPQGVDCRTTHAIAMAHVASTGRFNRDQLFNSIRPKQLEAELELKRVRIDDGVVLSGVQQAFLFLASVRQFCQSGDETILPSHVPVTGRLLGLREERRDQVKDWIAKRARALWEGMCDPADPVPLGHDGYLKLWSLARPKLGCDYILLDEAQDTNPCVLSVMEAQESQIVYVGDRHQQIYAWRGAVNAMETIETPETCYLTQSFRFGPAIAEAAGQILSALGEPETLRGNSARRSQIRPDGRADAVLARTNTKVIAEVLDALGAGMRPHIVGDTKELKLKVSSVYDLMDGQPGSHPDFFGFNHWNEVVEFAETDEGAELKAFVSLVQQHSPGALWAAITKAEPEEADADVTISTGHRGKGREWDAVRIADDFLSSQDESGCIPVSEARLFYVAITRAKSDLIVEPALLDAYCSAQGFIEDSELGAERERARAAAARTRRAIQRPASPARPDSRPTEESAPPKAPPKRRGFLSVFGLSRD